MESVLETVAENAPTEARSARAAFPWYLATATVGATSIIVGLLWDISWHATIGRDTFWTPAHLAIHFGGVLAGLSAGWLALKTTFAATPEERAVAVRFWGFRAPLGAWVSIWGALAMLTSAPFDDWWHNAYGLDVKILSPPHIVLAAGMIATPLGALLQVLAAQNRARAGVDRRIELTYVYLGGILLTLVNTMFLENSEPNLEHGAAFYQISCAAYPLLLVAIARGSRLRWPATATAGFYMALKLLIVWILPLFPAQPRLAPIWNPVTHMWPPFFPLLLVVPALAIDLLRHRFDRDRETARRSFDWQLAAHLAAAFLGVFLAVQWCFAEFMLTPHARNWFFAADQWTYGNRPGPWHYEFWDADLDPVTPLSLGIALALGTLSARLGLGWGRWMSRVRR